MRERQRFGGTSFCLACLTRWVFMAVVAIGMAACPARAGVIVFTGFDLGSGAPPAHPNSDAAAASFDAAAALIGSSSKITFESAPLGSFNNLVVAPGVSINGLDFQNLNQTIRNTSNFPANPALDGSNTTPGGSKFVEMQGGTLTFTFAQPTQFFGAYFTGIQTVFFTDSITFNDGTSQTVNILAPGTTSSLGATVFVGFTDAGKSITSITINAGIPGNPGAGFDDIGVDDVRFQSAPPAVPEPSSLALLSLGGLTLAGWRRWKKRATA
jgi:hypothetical protein